MVQELQSIVPDHRQATVDLSCRVLLLSFCVWGWVESDLLWVHTIVQEYVA